MVCVLCMVVGLGGMCAHVYVLCGCLLCVRGCVYTCRYVDVYVR